MYYYIIDKFVKASKANISIDYAGFLYGDGLFETMRFDNKKIFSPSKHINRLFQGLKIIGLKLQYSEEKLLNLLDKTISKNKLDSGIIRLMITRGNLNVSSENYNKPSIIVIIKNFYNIPENPVRVLYLSESNFPIIRFNPAIKSMNYIGNMLAKKHAEFNDAFEPVFYNNQNIITECAIRNIFYVKNQELITPSLDLGILSGVMRDTIIEVASSMKLNIKEDYISFNNINEMDEAFISSSGIGLLTCYWE